MSCAIKNITRLIQDSYRSPRIKYNTDISADIFTLNIYGEFSRTSQMTKIGLFADDDSVYFERFDLPIGSYKYEIIRTHNGKDNLIISGKYEVTDNPSKCTCESSDTINFIDNQGDEVFSFEYTEVLLNVGGGGPIDLSSYAKKNGSNISDAATWQFALDIFTNELAQQKFDAQDSVISANTDAIQDLTTQVIDGLEAKVDKIDGFGLSEENFSQEEKTKLAGLEDSKFKGKYPSLSALTSANVGVIGGYAYVGSVGVDDKQYIWDDDDSKWVPTDIPVTAETAATIKAKYESNPDTYAFNGAYKTKLEGLSNYNDSALQTAIANKVDKDGAKVLSDQNYTLTEKNKLSGIAANANNYTLPQATATVLGGLKVWTGTQTAYDAIATKDASVFYFIEKT